MIPDRIFLAGFLCYREPQEVCFDGRTLWMLAGPNGSGKSALFDALTYVLFGQHRGGKHNARGLIHHACDDFSLAFDFTLDDKRYRARRTLTRQGRCTRQIDAWTTSPAHPTGSWRTIPETQTEKGFAQWIDAHVALTYDTFTTSVLLLQGRADNLLLAAPAERHRLLGQVVGLDRIERLHQLARQHLARSEGTVRTLQQQTKQLLPVAASQLSRLRTRAQVAAAEHSSQIDSLNQLSGTLQQARRWEELTLHAERLQQEIDQLQQLVDALQGTQQQHARWLELGTHLTTLTQFAHSTQQLGECRERMAATQVELQTLEPQWQLVTSEIRAAERALAEARQRMARDLATETSLRVQSTELERAHGATCRFAQVRDRFQKATETLDNIERQVIEAREGQADTDRSSLSEAAIQLAQAAVRGAAEALAQRTAIADQARQQLQRFQTVAAQQVCAYCLQPLSTAHIQREEVRLADELRRTDELVAQATCELQQAEAQHRQLQQQRSTQLARRDTWDQHVKTLTIRLQAGKLAEQDLASQCRQAYLELPHTLSRAASTDTAQDWNSTTYPTDADLAQLADSLDQLRQHLTNTADSVRAQQQTIERLERQLRHRSTEYHALQQQIQALKDRVTIATGRLAGLTEVQDAVRHRVPDQCRDLGAEQLTDWIARIQQARNELGSSAADAGQHDLDQVLKRQRECQVQRDLVLHQLAAMPKEARCAGQDIEDSIQAARRVLKCRELELQKAREEEAQALADVDHRAVMLQRLRDARQQEGRWKRLAALLGREGLQHDLLRSAEKAIVEYANAILDRLAGGQLYVELAQPIAGRSGAPKVLDLLARTTGGNSAVQDVAFLSGSQKFRVAVALSLAIGQFASNRRRPVQAVIIDEGFGCLDAVNRQVMIQELQNLRSQLKRILLVSHQDEFASAFPDGYHCELVDGTTRLTPFHP